MKINPQMYHAIPKDGKIHETDAPINALDFTKYPCPCNPYVKAIYGRAEYKNRNGEVVRTETVLFGFVVLHEGIE